MDRIDRLWLGVAVLGRFGRGIPFPGRRGVFGALGDLDTLGEIFIGLDRFLFDFRLGHDGEDHVRVVEHFDVPGELQILHGQLLSDMERRNVAIDVLGNRRRQAIHEDFAVDEIHQATLVLDTLRRSQKVDGNANLHLAVGIDAHEIDMSQTLVDRALTSSSIEAERKQKYETLRARAEKVFEVANAPRFHESFRVYPFNSGYFMCVEVNEVSAEKLRVHLLDEYGIGVIATGQSDVRIAFSCLEVHEIEPLFEVLHKAIQELI